VIMMTDTEWTNYASTRSCWANAPTSVPALLKYFAQHHMGLMAWTLSPSVLVESDVVHGDGTRLPFGAGQFSAATLFTMLHHVPSEALQDRLLAEVRRVLRPGGLVVGSDGMATPARRELHAGDDYLPIDPGGLAARLAAAGFTDPVVEVNDDRFRFLAAVPA
jgi:SAM-dependent methyltransferase